MNDFQFGVIHKQRGQFFGYFDHTPFLWTILLNMAYVEIWIFGYPPPRVYSTPPPFPCTHCLWIVSLTFSRQMQGVNK